MISYGMIGCDVHAWCQKIANIFLVAISRILMDP